MKTTRRSFLAALAALPVVGRLFGRQTLSVGTGPAPEGYDDFRHLVAKPYVFIPTVPHRHARSRPDGSVWFEHCESTHMLKDLFDA